MKYYGELVVYKALYEDCQAWGITFKKIFSEVPKDKYNLTNQKLRFEPYKIKRKSEYEEGD